MFTPAC